MKHLIPPALDRLQRPRQQAASAASKVAAGGGSRISRGSLSRSMKSRRGLLPESDSRNFCSPSLLTNVLLKLICSSLDGCLNWPIPSSEIQLRPISSCRRLTNPSRRGSSLSTTVELAVTSSTTEQVRQWTRHRGAAPVSIISADSPSAGMLLRQLTDSSMTPHPDNVND